MKRQAAAAGLTLIALFAVNACAGNGDSRTSRAKACPAGFERDKDGSCTAPDESGTAAPATAAPFTNPPTTTPPPPTNPPTISLAEYNAIQSGWTLQQVIDTIGGPGQVEYQSEYGGYKTEGYKWIGTGFGTLGSAGEAHVQFSNDKVAGKSQFGLS
jgi:hypothetical protein